MAWSPDGRRIASGSYDVTARVWDAATGRELLTLRGEAEGRGSAAGIWSVGWSPDGRQVATGFNYAEKQKVKIWDSETGKLLQALSPKSGLAMAVNWSPDGRRLATASADQTAKVWDTGTWKLLLDFRAASGNGLLRELEARMGHASPRAVKTGRCGSGMPPRGGSRPSCAGTSIGSGPSPGARTVGLPRPVRTRQ